LKRGLLFLLLAGALHACDGGDRGPVVAVGSKKFTESVILGEIATQLARAEGLDAVHRRELGGTRILFEALRRGDIDAYPEYTGTLREELLRGVPEGQVVAELARQGLAMTPPLGFDNTYAIGVRRALAEKLRLRTLSDLASHPELALGFSNEFLSRADGWPSLRERYRFAHADVRGLDHDLAYRALASGDIAATDLYSTDAEIRAFDLVVLEDDLDHFPDYQAVLLYRAELEPRAPEAVAAWRNLAGRIDEAAMISLNARAKLERVPEGEVAAAFLLQSLGVQSTFVARSRLERLRQRTAEHLALVASSLLMAVLVGIPLGLAAAKRRRMGQVILAVVGVVQTVPSLALLVFMIPLFGIGTWPAIAALFLYSLLPIVRGTHAGVVGIPAELQDSARTLGLPPWTVLGRIELPLASRAILSGIKTSAVINVGTATLGALIGAGGFGQPILTGIRLADVGLILEGAVPAAALALLVQGGFDLIERVAVPRGLQLQRGR
jgi:osmoprotectant transport system permease protein